MKDKFPSETRAAYLSGDVTPLIRATLRRMRLEFETTLYQFNTESGGVDNPITYPLPPDEPPPDADFGYKVGTFVKSTSTGSQSITGLGFKPQVIMTWNTRQTSIGSSGSNIKMTMGMACRGSDDTIYQAGQGWGAYHGQSGSNTRTAQHMSNDSMIIGCDMLKVLEYEAAVTSFDDDGFTLNWSTNEALSAIFGYTAFASADLSEVFIKNYLSKSSTGTQAQTGVGFQPDFLMNIASGVSALEGSRVSYNVGFGAGDAATQRGHGGGAENAYWAGGTGGSYFRDAAHIAIPDRAQVAGVQYREAIDSLDADGFTIDTEDSNGFSYGQNTMCLKGMSNLKVGSFSAPDSNGEGSVTGVGFKPDLVIFFGSANPVENTPWNGSDTNFWGAMDADGNMYSICHSYDFANPSKAWRRHEENYCVFRLDDNVTDGTVDKMAEFVSMDTDGFTLDWTIDYTSEMWVGWIAIKVTEE